MNTVKSTLRVFSFLNFIYLFMRDTETQREAETQAAGEAGSMQGAQRGTRPQDRGPQDHTLGRRWHQMAEPPGPPSVESLTYSDGSFQN